MVLELDFDFGKVVVKNDSGHFLDQDLLSNIFDHLSNLYDHSPSHPTAFKSELVKKKKSESLSIETK